MTQYSYQPYYVIGLLLIHIWRDANFMPDEVLVIEITIFFFYNLCYKDDIFSLDIAQCLRATISDWI